MIPVLQGEDPKIYRRLQECLAIEIDPQDIIEWFWVRDLTDLAWDSRRLRLIKAALINTGIPFAARHLVGPMIMSDLNAVHVLEGDQAESLVRRANAGSKRDEVKLEMYLETSCLDQSALIAASYGDQVSKIEAIDSGLAKNERRRGAILRDLELHRATLANFIRQPSNTEITDVELQ